MTERINILGVGVSAMNMAMTIDTVDEWVLRDEPPLRMRYRSARHYGILSQGSGAKHS